MLEFLAKNSDNLLNYALYLLIFIVVRFLIQGIGLFLIAKKRYAKKPVLALIPLLSPSALGGIADKVNLRRGKKTNNALTLMLLSIFKTITYFGFLAATFFSFKAIILNAADAIVQDISMTPDMFKSAIAIIITFFIALVLAIIYAVYYYISLFKVYKSEMNTSIAVVAFILSLIAPFVREITLLVLGIAAKEEIGFEIE